MNGLKIIADKCCKCMNCVTVCLTGVIMSDGIDPIIDYDNPLCIKCFHCAAACPEEAIVLEDDGICEKLSFSHEEFIKKFGLDNEIEHFLISRRSCRSFKAKHVPREEITHALEMAAWAPSAGNAHPVKWIVIDDKEKLNNIMNIILDYVKKSKVSQEILMAQKQGKNIVMGQSDTVILAYSYKYDGMMPQVDTVIATHEAELVLQSRGIGACWSGYMVRMCKSIPELRELLNLPKDHEVYGAIFVGYPEESYVGVPNRLKRAEIMWE